MEDKEMIQRIERLLERARTSSSQMYGPAARLTLEERQYIVSRGYHISAGSRQHIGKYIITYPQERRAADLRRKVFGI